MSSDERTVQHIQNEYHQMCLKMGELAYHIFAHEKALDETKTLIEKKKEELCEIQKQTQIINQEAAELMKKEALCKSDK